ncbi:MAG: OmpA family protein [Bacteroidota bacterium]
MNISKILTLLFITSSAFSQNLSGVWQGELTQETGGTSEKYHFELLLEHRGDSITGRSRIANIETPAVRGELLLRGTWDGELFRFLEYKILPTLATINPPNLCIKKAKLTLEEGSGVEKLTGSWEGVSPVYGQCAPGTIIVKRTSNEIPEPTKVQTAVAVIKKKVVFEGKELEEGSIVELEAINFAPASAELVDTQALQKLLDFLEEHPKIQVELSGHTDKNPDPEHKGYARISRMHLDLSKKRLDAVVNFLKSKGIKTNRIVKKAYGGTKPLINASAPENRRVEMKILKIE